MKMNKEDGKKLIELARKAILSELRNKEIEIEEEVKNKFSEKKGVFTTLYTYPDKLLRGCIGLPYPTNPLWEAIIISSRDSAFSDPRFLPMRDEAELNKIVIEITILTPPRLLDVPPSEYKSYIKLGKTGLMVQKGIFRGLLLPQVATEYGFDEERFLSETCKKAGLSPDDWKDKDTKVFIFEGFKIKEKEPNGEVEVEE